MQNLEQTLRESDLLPKPPTFGEEDYEYARRSDDYTPLLFEWYKFVGEWAVIIGCIQIDSPAFRPISPQTFHILVGLITRCARLMTANVALSHDRGFGEATAILDRCIFESCIKLAWLIDTNTDERVHVYLVDGLRTELALKANILSKIAGRNGKVLNIEARMLRSIEWSIQAAGVTEKDISKGNRLPSFQNMMKSIGFSDDLHYVVGMRLGSHHVHGTWQSLLMHYLEELDPEKPMVFGPKGQPNETHINQFMYICITMLDALSLYIEYAIADDVEAHSVLKILSDAKSKIQELYAEARSDDDRVHIGA